MAVALTILLALTGMVVDYLNWEAVAGAADSHVGPGFYVALAGSGVLLLGTVLSWRWIEVARGAPRRSMG